MEVCQDCGEVACALDHRAGGGAKTDAELAGDDLGEGGLAQSRRTMQQHVVQGLAAGAGGLDEHREVLPAGLLADELRQCLRTKGCFGGIFVTSDGGDRAGCGRVMVRLPLRLGERVGGWGQGNVRCSLAPTRFRNGRGRPGTGAAAPAALRTAAHPGALWASSFRLSRITASSGAASPSRSITRLTAGCASGRR